LITFGKKSVATTSMIFQSSLICQQKLKQVTFEGKLHQLSERDCSSPVKSYNSCRIIEEQQGFQNCLLHYNKELTFFHRSRLLWQREEYIFWMSTQKHSF